MPPEVSGETLNPRNSHGDFCIQGPAASYGTLPPGWREPPARWPIRMGPGARGGDVADEGDRYISRRRYGWQRDVGSRKGGEEPKLVTVLSRGFRRSSGPSAPASGCLFKYLILHGFLWSE